MPSNYAHHRFGVQLLPSLPAEVRSSVEKHRNLFDVGLNGPDFFFFHCFGKRTRTAALGSAFHRQSGREFFTRVCDALRPAPSEAALSYLYGVLGHYCLDSHCHPFVHECADNGVISHVALESEFDRYLLTNDGKRAPADGPERPLRYLSRRDCALVSRFYAPVTPARIASCNNRMRLSLAVLTSPNPALRAALKAALSVGSAGDVLMPPQPDPRLRKLDEQLLACYRTAMARYPELLRSVRAHLYSGEPLPAVFDPAFG